eukprot:526080-Alexandrium_andersonii.AAC.1
MPGSGECAGTGTRALLSSRPPPHLSLHRRWWAELPQIVTQDSDLQNPWWTACPEVGPDQGGREVQAVGVFSGGCVE